MEPENKLMEEKLSKLESIRKEGINPYPYKFNVTGRSSELKEKYAELSNEEKTKDKASVAGRIMTMRRMGKATFLNIQDHWGQMQAYIREDDIGKEKYSLLKNIDLGDFLGVSGIVFKTKTGEVTIYAESFNLLTKSIRPLPDKFHGIQDIELKYRKRYLDLMFSPGSKKIFVMRSKIIREIRDFLDKREFIEVETPILQPIYGGASAKPFVTHHNALDMKLYMKISPELYLKRLIVGGFDRVYDLGRNFRNEGIDHNHNPEFTMLEFYQAYADYNDMMDMVEEMIRTVAKNVLGKTEVEFKGNRIDLGKSFRRLSMKDAIKEYGKVDVDKMSDDELKKLAEKHELDIKGEATRGVIINGLFEVLAEDKLIQPTFIMDYPVEVSPLTKVHRKDPKLTERFELFIAGQEWANAYSELNDPVDQRNRLLEQEKKRVIDEEAQPMDEDFVESIEYGMPPTGGLGLGIDRLIMLLSGAESIRDVILFPTLRNRQEQ